MPATALPLEKTQTVSLPQDQGRSSRYLFIDGLRGIAASLVLLHHLLHGTMLEIPLTKVLPSPLKFICDHGSAGVEIFFVISGFVIAHSLRNLSTRKDLAKFIVRRQLRLDPPYWCALVLYLAAMIPEHFIPGLTPNPTPTAHNIFLNVFYLQRIADGTKPDIVGGAWTLCLEIQFYLLTAAILLGAEILRRKKNANWQKLTIDWTVAILAIVSLSRSFGTVSGAWFIDYWVYFASGLLCYRSFRDGKPSKAFLLLMTVLVCTTGVLMKPEMILGLVTVSMIYLSCRIGTLDRWLAQPLFQYLGKISYSLYLLNLLMAWSILRLGFKITGYSEPMALIWFVLGGAASIGAAHLFYTFVEKPSVVLGQKVKANW
jgi:hypothetical protein